MWACMVTCFKFMAMENEVLLFWATEQNFFLAFQHVLPYDSKMIRYKRKA